MSKGKIVSFETTREVHDRCLCFATQRAARALARRFDAALRPVGLTSGQYSLLMSLNRPEPPSLGAVAELLGMDRTTLTANLKPLLRNGWANSAVDPDDRRGRRLSLTAKGRKVLTAALPIWRRTHAEIDAALPPPLAPRALQAGLRALAVPEGVAGR
ncbi:MAG: winged helix-turn-helix transcriptional regulator [Proteobacteria bacterium]|nr:winged helix-turn-helix transcriptional regulator [Pseudomonadota bacterium]